MTNSTVALALEQRQQAEDGFDRDTRSKPRPIGRPVADDGDDGPPAAWRKVWRQGLAQVLNVLQLDALLVALRVDDPTLTQGSTVTPPPMQCCLDWKPEGGCVVSFAGWRGNRLATVGDVEAFFADICCKVDDLLGERGAVRYFLNWFDQTPRDEMRALLGREVEREIEGRGWRVVRGQAGESANHCACQDSGCCCAGSLAAERVSAMFHRADDLRKGYVS